MSWQEIIERFMLISGLDVREAARLTPLIRNCKDYFEARLRGDLDEAGMRRAEHACAVYAYYVISLMNQSDEAASFKVGDVQFQPLSVNDTAEKLWMLERAQIEDIVDIGGDFAFRGVAV